MNRLLILVGLLTLLVPFPPPAAAQWPRHPTPGVPRTATGGPDLAAPVPRTPEGKPDLSGIWVRAVVPPGAPADPPPGTPPVATFRNVGANFKDGLPLQPWAKELQAQRSAANSKDNPDALCLPMGLMQFHTHGQPRRMVQTRDLIILIYEANYGLRYIYMDGRPQPTNDPQPWWYGYSTGRWDGDTLVVETSHLRDDGWHDIIGNPQTSAAKVTERFKRVSFGRLEIDVTFDDPKAYTRPWTVRVNQQISVDNEMIEFICNENQQFLKRVKVP